MSEWWVTAKRGTRGLTAPEPLWRSDGRGAPTCRTPPAAESEPDTLAQLLELAFSSREIQGAEVRFVEMTP